MFKTLPHAWSIGNMISEMEVIGHFYLKFLHYTIGSNSLLLLCNIPGPETDGINAADQYQQDPAPNSSMVPSEFNGSGMRKLKDGSDQNDDPINGQKHTDKEPHGHHGMFLAHIVYLPFLRALAKSIS
jgi:hypothetical protein